MLKQLLEDYEKTSTRVKMQISNDPYKTTPNHLN